MLGKSTGWQFTSSIDEARVNLARALIHALGFSRDGEATPVHVNRLSALFRRYYPNDSVVDALQLLLLIKEVIELPEGLWVPSACRSVVIDGVGKLLVSPHSTEELQRGLGVPVQRLRYGRICQHGETDIFEIESLESWAESCESLEEWTRQALRKCDSDLAETVDTRRSIEVYKSWADQGTGSFSYQPWCKYPSEERIPEGKFLCREKTPQGQWRSFLGEFRQRGIVRECDLTVDHLRFRFGLDRLSGRKIELRTNSRGGRISFELRRHLPLSERRIVVALMSDIEPVEVGVVVSIEPRMYPTIKNALNSLGMTFGERANG